MMLEQIVERLGPEANSLLTHTCRGIPKETLHLPSADHLSEVFGQSDRSSRVLVNLGRIFAHGRLAGTGYVSMLPVDQGVEHSAAASFAPNPEYFDPENIVRLAVEGGCNAVASTVAVLAQVSRRYAHKIPFIAKINHNEMLTFPSQHKQMRFASVKHAWDLGAAAVGATVYFGSDDASRELVEIAQAFEEAHDLGLGTVLWCYLRNPAFKKDGIDYHVAADLTGQANHLGATLHADIVKQKLPVTNNGYRALSFGHTHARVYSELTSEHPVDLVRWQVANCYMGRVSLINSGGASSGASDLNEAVRTAVVNKRGGGTGLISGRKAFQRPMREGVALLNAIQDVYLCEGIGVA